MRKFSRRMTSGVLAAAMMIPTLSLPAAAETAEAESYKIYPTPHSIVYKEGTADITSDVNVVYSAGIDEFTKARAAEVFELIDSSVSVSDAKVEGKTNVYVGIKGEGSMAETYFDEKNSIQASDLFEKTDAYALQIDGDVISVLGVSSDAAFYGLTSLKHIFKQIEGRTVRNLLMEDYADVKTRGFIEGYYGNPWSTEDRADLMKFGGDYKLNGYFYAPKDDPKHNSHWRDLYTEEELEKHAQLAQAGNESKCYYIYALHPFMHNAINFGTGYDSDLQIIKDKFEQMMNVGVKQFAILADDAGVPSVGGASSYVRLMTDLTNWIKEKQAEYPGLKSDMIFCPNDYMGNGSSSQMQTLKNLPDSVSIIETGGRVWGTVGPDFNDTFYNNMGRPAFMWINWPCSDNTKDSLIMGAATRFMTAGTNPETVDGIVLNPMQQSEPSKQGIFTNADYAWNIWENNSEYDQLWEDSFNYIDHGTNVETKGSAALRELSKHMQFSASAGTDESVDLKDSLNSFKNKVANGESVLADIPQMRQEFEILAQAAKDYREDAGNKRTLDQIIYWIDAWDDTTEAVLRYLDTLELIENDAPLSQIWDTFSKAQDAHDRSKTHALWYMDHYEFAKAGRKYVTPFMDSLDSSVSALVLPLVDPSKEMTTWITSRSDTPTGNISDVFDNSASTEIIYKTPASLEAGDYVGVRRTRPFDVDEVSIRLGQSQNLNDTFSKAKLQYTQDGTTWIDYGEELTAPKEISHTNMGLKNVLGLRVVATEGKTNTWLGVRDFVVNPSKSPSSVSEATFSLPAGNAAYSGTSAASAHDGNNATYVWTNQTAKVDDTFTWTYPKKVNARNVHIAMGNGTSADKWNSFALETTTDGVNWTRQETFSSPTEGIQEFNYDLRNVEVTGVRIRNLAAVSKWVQLSEFTVEVSEGDPYDKEHLLTNTSLDAGVYFMDTESKLKAEGEITLQPGEYLGLDMERIVEIDSIHPATDAAGITVESSRNNYEWEQADLDHPAAARYVRLINNTDAPVTFTMSGDMTVKPAATGEVTLDSTDITVTTSNWAGEDSRNNGAAFDNDVTTSTEFANLPQKDQYIIYDLGQMRTISKLAIYNQDSATNYIRDAQILISADKENWTKVIEIGDGVENEDDADVRCIDSDAGYTASSRYPNKVFKEGTVEPTQARYIKILMTASNQNRAVVFNEIEINDGEYVPISNPAFRTDSAQKQGAIPANLVDGDLSTNWTPADDKAGYIEYDFSDSLENNHFNIIAKGESSYAIASARVIKEGKEEWVNLGVIDLALNQLAVDAEKVLTIRVEWLEGCAPDLSEIISYYEPYTASTVDRSMLDAAIAKAKAVLGSDFIEETAQPTVSIDRKVPESEKFTTQVSADKAAADLNAALLQARRTPSKEALDALK